MAGTGSVVQFGTYIENSITALSVDYFGVKIETIFNYLGVDQFGVYLELDYNTDYPRVSNDGETSIIFNPFIVK